MNCKYGISLVVLIIEIIVVVTLASVSIGLMTNSSIIDKAQKAVQDSNEKNNVEIDAANALLFDDYDYVLITEAGLQVEDKINYPVLYTNALTTNPDDMESTLLSNETGWIVLANYIDDDTNEQVIKIISAGTPENIDLSEVIGEYANGTPVEELVTLVDHEVAKKVIKVAGENNLPADADYYSINYLDQYGRSTYFNSKYGKDYGVFPIEDATNAYETLGGCDNKIFNNRSYYWMNMVGAYGSDVYIGYVTDDGFARTSITPEKMCGIRPVITLKNDLKVKKIEKSNDDYYWEIYKN